MERLTQLLLPAVQTVNNYLSDYVLLFLLVGTGVFFTLKTGFVQVRCLGEGLRQVFGGLLHRGQKQESGMSSFQALTTAIAAQVGTGNIVGASGAILLGGPGAIFWMWVIAFFGMATVYAEAVLAQKTRTRDENGQILGGPVYYIRAAFPGAAGRFLAGFFAVALILALGFLLLRIPLALLWAGLICLWMLFRCWAPAPFCCPGVWCVCSGRIRPGPSVFSPPMWPSP